MDPNTSRILIETVVRKAIHDIKDSPKRSTRNLIDMALQFSGGRFQQRFFQVAQTALQNENSSYYDMVQDIVAHVDEERLVTFGMNLGYNSCTLGAKKIRDIEERDGYHVPWSVVLHMNKAAWLQKQEVWQSAISQGESLGIYTWQIYFDADPVLLLPLFSMHPDSAFLLYCTASQITSAFLDEAVEQKHVMPVLCYDENAANLCSLLRHMGMLYSVSYTYTPENLETVLSGDLFYGIQQLHPAFTVLTAAPECTREMRDSVYALILDFRNRQVLETIPWESLYDRTLVDSIISAN